MKQSTVRNLGIAALVAVAGTCFIIGVGPDGAKAELTVERPGKIVLNAVIRDFKGKAESGGHPDFEAFTGTTRIGHVEDRLGSDGKPTLASLTGEEIETEATDEKGVIISPRHASEGKKDKKAKVSKKTDKKITSKASFDQWYRDTLGVNQSRVVPLTLNFDKATGRYIFDSALDEPYKSRGGFFPINGELYGNFSSTGKNFHFTTEIATTFTHQAGKNHVFKFTGDDDVWVFINGQLVIDLGSLHSKKEQSVFLDRLGLTDGMDYELKIFHAERRTSQSNFRMEATFVLRKVSPPSVGAAFD